MLASGASLLIALLIAELVVMRESPAVFTATGSTFLIFLVTLVPMVWRRLATDYGFTLAQSPDGIRIRRGLLGTVAETIPLRRVQAVRMVEPMLWRPLGWCRLEIDVAGPRAATTPTDRAGCARPCCRWAIASRPGS